MPQGALVTIGSDTGTTPPESLVPSEAEDWIKALRAEDPLYTSFPVTLPNGGLIKNFVGLCSGCKRTISGDRVRGRVMWSLPTVATVEANGYCNECKKVTHLHCRFRAHEKTYKVEWIGSDGNWYARVADPTPWWRRAALFFWGARES